MRPRQPLSAFCLFCLAAVAPSCWGQIGGADSPGRAAGGSGERLPRFGAALGMSTLGAAVQAATALTRHSNLRFGFNGFNYRTQFETDGISYDAGLQLRSAEVFYDRYIARSFHVSPGLLMYDGNQAAATVSVPGGQSFSLGAVQYVSDSSDPVSGSGSIRARKVAPLVLLGFGNLLPRSARHFTVNFEFGAVFQGSPSALLSLTGTACSATGANCTPLSNPAIQANVTAEQNKINRSLAALQYYPVVSLTFGYKF